MSTKQKYLDLYSKAMARAKQSEEAGLQGMANTHKYQASIYLKNANKAKD